MKIWSYSRPFKFHGHSCEVKVRLTGSKTISSLYVDDFLVDEQSIKYTDGLITFIHPLQSSSGYEAKVESGYFNWWNVGIAVTENGRIVHESHPGEDLSYGEALMEDLYGMKENASGAAESKWAENKYSIYADLGLAALFFIVSKVTGDLVLAAIVGGVTGLGLIVLQRFVKVDLLGGFAVFGTIMLAISTTFSLVLQDSYWVQMKSTALGLFTAALFMADGLLRQGAYFGARFERYMPGPLHHNRLAIGMSIMGIVSAGGNYFVAENFSEDFWLTYTTFLDFPIIMVSFFLILRWARKPEGAIEGTTE
jgi:intracellular septation protein A